MWHGVVNTQHALVCGGACGVCVCGSGACTESRVSVCEGGGGTRALVVVVGGKASVTVAWEAHTGHTHHQAPPWPTPPVPLCVCVMVGHKGRGGGDHTSNHPCMGHACASRVSVWRMRAGG